MERLTYNITCRSCKQNIPIELSEKEYMDLTEYMLFGTSHIQDVLPDHPRTVRELFISGICGECWVRMFGPLEEE